MIKKIPIAMRWKISKDDLMPAIQSKVHQKYFLIDEFPDNRFIIVFTSNPRNELIVTFCVLFKNDAVNIQPISADIKLSIPSAYYSSKIEFIYETSSGKDKLLCTFDELFDPTNKYFNDDTMTIYAEGVLSVGNEHHEEEQKNVIVGNEAAPKAVGEVLWSRDNKDFDLHVDGKIIKIHKLIISVKSSVFDRMFQAGMKESQEAKVTITDFDYETTEMAMKFCYDLEITQLLNVSNAIKLLQFSDKYDMVNLKDAIESFFYSKISPMNVCEIANAAIVFNASKLEIQCFEFLLQCIEKKVAVFELDLLDKEFAFKLLKDSFTRY